MAMSDDSATTFSLNAECTPKAWRMRLEQLAKRALGQQVGDQLCHKYHNTFPPDYQALISPRFALQDMLYLEQIDSACDHVSLLNPNQGINHFRLHFYSLQRRFLDEYIPVLENMHLRVMDQVQFSLVVDGKMLFIRSFTIQAGSGQCEPFPKLRKRLLQAIQAVLDGKVENDTLNKLLVLTGLSWQEIDVLRAYRNYFLQLGHQITGASIHHAFLTNPLVALGLFNYFEARFKPDPAWDNPANREEQALSPIRLQLLENIAAVTDLNDDRILRTLFNLIDATVRSNFYVRRDLPDYFIAFKVNSLGVIDMPVPKPMYEIFVHAVDMQGIHLRAGKISRGGIRWSDRTDDFRTEILGLMQTQISKNALIIPTGAKGGFVLKKNGTKLDIKAAGKKAYLTLIHGLLDLTDNYNIDKILTPPGIVVYDDTDPYLVVAADKGTASFSDIANAAASKYDFWLGDAFASGGSQGYDHKALGITARGAWECVKRHFRELDRDIQSEPFTVIGIGSMDGDVFGNAMLLSPFIRLRAAFSGQHIFLDPQPAETLAPFNERKRLFEQSGTSWNDYDRTLISEGGGVYLRANKDIPVSPELRKWLGIRYKTLDGEALIRYLLAASIDLFWLGGIGTYAKASNEKHEEVGDRANDNVRVDAATIRALVVGEGANLGFTQKARIEYALAGGRINTDAVDNSAGVDTSDHEVNLKTLLTGLHKQNVITDYQALFDKMTNDVCTLVLADNVAQSLCLSLEQIRSAEHAENYLQLAERLEELGFLDREVESFPSAKEILTRAGKTLTRPELAVLMATSKRYLTQQLENNIDFLQDKCCSKYLPAYFPERINDHYQKYLSDHPLADAIKATIISNKIINQAGCEFLSFNTDNEEANILDLVSCYLTFDNALNANEFRQAIHNLDNQIATKKQYPLLIQVENTLADICRWSSAHNQKIRPNIETIVLYRRYLTDYQHYFNRPKNLDSEVYQTQLSQYRQDGIPDELALNILFISSLEDFPFIVSLATELKLELKTVLNWLNDVNDFLGLPAIYTPLKKFPKKNYWEGRITSQIESDIQHTLGQLLKKALAANAADCISYFAMQQDKSKLDRYRRIYLAAIAAQPISLLPFITLVRELQELVESDS